LHERNPEAARELALAIHHAVRGLRENPGLGRSGRVEGTRELVVARTRYIVPYRVRGRVVELLAVMHDAREWPGGFSG
jgi:toxin ParE1/3/4